MSISTNYNFLHTQYIEQQDYPELNLFLEGAQKEGSDIINKFKIDVAEIPVNLDVLESLISILTTDKTKSACTDIAVQKKVHNQTQLSYDEAMKILHPLLREVDPILEKNPTLGDEIRTLFSKLCIFSEGTIDRITQSHAAQGYDAQMSYNFTNHFLICGDIRNFITNFQNKKEESNFVSRVVVVYQKEFRMENASSFKRTIQAVAVLGEKIILDAKYLEIVSLISAVSNLPNYDKITARTIPNRVKGAGTAIINFCVQECINNSYKGVYVEASLTAVPFYEKCKFSKLSENAAQKSTDENPFQKVNLVRLMPTPV